MIHCGEKQDGGKHTPVWHMKTRHLRHIQKKTHVILQEPFFFTEQKKMADNDDLLDYEDEEQNETTAVESQEAPKKDVKGTYVSIHSSGFRDFLLKPEILRAIVDCGFEHPSEGM